jgi:hypothetical protein
LSNPSDDVYGKEHWQVRLEVPSFNIKLSDALSELVKYSTFDFTLFNEDGYFDDLESTNFFNGPAYIKKTWIENPEPEDFIPIRYGMVESIKINDKKMTVSCADIFRTLEEPVSKVVKDVFLNAVKNRDSELPVLYGTATIPLIEIDTNLYVAGEDITNVSAVYDKDGNPISFTITDSVISAIGANYCKATGKTANKIGEVITDIISTKTNVKYIDSFWDLNETNIYIASSPAINILFTGGTVQEAVKKALSSDMVFLIQKNNGRFTLRKWNETYNEIIIENWKITQFPTKNYSEAQKNYLSSCIINYNYNFNSKEYESSLLYNNDEKTAESAYNKLVRKTFNTYLENDTDATVLGDKISSRFSTLRETIQIGVGCDTSTINLLDTIHLDLVINGRTFSKYKKWIVKEINPAQDIMVLEPVTEI